MQELICPASEIAGVGFDISERGGKIKLPEERCHQAMYACIGCPLKRQGLCVGLVDVEKREIVCIPFGDEIPEKRKIFDKYKESFYSLLTKTINGIYEDLRTGNDKKILYGPSLKLDKLGSLLPDPNLN